jgi:hypothetical protein
MNGANPEIHDLLQEFTAYALLGIQAEMLDSHENDNAAARELVLRNCLWVNAKYSQTLEALAALRAFSGDKKMADAYICGYYRGLKTAAWSMQPRATKLKRKRK